MASQPASCRLSAAPTIAPTAKIHESQLGAMISVSIFCQCSIAWAVIAKLRFHQGEMVEAPEDRGG